MFDDLHTSDDANGDLGYPPPSAASSRLRSSPSPIAPVGDVEVPVPAGGTPALLHQWLDGDIKVSVMRATPGGNEAVDLWNRIHDEAETLRSRTTPLHVHKRIMESLPDDAYRLQQPWYRRGVSVNPILLLAGAAALVALGAAVAQAAFR